MRILLAYDGSTNATTAANLVRVIAWPPDSILRVISVIEPKVVGLTAWAGSAAGYSSEVDLQISAYYEGKLAAVVESLNGPDRTEEGAVLRGRPASVIVDEARVFQADLVVVGSRGHGAIASLVLGSVSGEVVDHAPCPVLVARQPTLSRVIFAADGSSGAATAEAFLARWPIFAGVPIRVVSVADIPYPWYTEAAPMMSGQVIEAADLNLEQARSEQQAMALESSERLRAAGRDATEQVRTGDPASEIIAVGAVWNADLLVLGSRGRTGLTRLLLGSVVRNVVHSSAASILVVRDAVET
ncbi:MAG: universal stress protein [Candidatus Limnocylindrales bacterium]